MKAQDVLDQKIAWLGAEQERHKKDKRYTNLLAVRIEVYEKLKLLINPDAVLTSESQREHVSKGISLLAIAYQSRWTDRSKNYVMLTTLVLFINSCRSHS